MRKLEDEMLETKEKDMSLVVGFMMVMIAIMGLISAARHEEISSAIFFSALALCWTIQKKTPTTIIIHIGEQK